MKSTVGDISSRRQLPNVADRSSYKNTYNSSHSVNNENGNRGGRYVCMVVVGNGREWL